MGPTDTPLQFGDFRIDVANAQLTRQGEAVALPPKAFDLLAMLLRRPGELVTKDELLDEVWGRRFVSEGAIKTVVSELRAALADDVKSPRWIATVPRRGYRFIGNLQAAPRIGPAPAAPPGPGPRGNLPRPRQPLVGRAAALTDLQLLLDRCALVTLTGPGGVGKTQLALAAAQARQPAPPSGVWWVELAPLPASADTAVVRSAVAQALQLAPAGVASDAELCRALNGSAMLVLLDNAEHLVDVLAPWLAGLQARLPDLRWLVTSREPLHVAGEQLLRLDPLAVPADDEDADPTSASSSAAVALFVERVAARLPGFTVQPAQRAAVARLCRALDGLPLALELAAARVPVLGVHGLAAQLAGDGARLALLTQGLRDAPPHQRTLRAAVAWSCELLTPAQQRAYRRLAVFRGGFALAAAHTVVAEAGQSEAEVLDLVTALVDKSLLVAEPPSRPDLPPRFTQLATLREHAQECLDLAGETSATQRRHLRAVQAQWAAADDGALTEQVLPWTAQQVRELENLRAALRWGLAALRADAAPDVRDDVAGLLAHSAIFWPRAGLAPEGADGYRQLDAHLAGAVLAEPLQARLDLGRLTLSRFTRLLPPQDCIPLAQRAAAALTRAGDRPRAYYAHYLRWTQELELDERAGRSEAMAQMQSLARPDWSPYLLRFVESAQAHEDRLAGRSEAYLQGSRAHWTLFRRLGAQGESWSAGLGLMLAEQDAGRPEAALAIGQELVDDIRQAGRLRTYGQCVCLYTTMLAERGDLPAVRPALGEALPLLPTLQACEVLYLALAWLAHREGRDDDAARWLGWFESPQRGGGNHGEGTYQWRAAQSLSARLTERLGAERLAGCRDAAAGWGHAAALARSQVELAPPPAG